MALFQNAVLNKYLSGVDEKKIEEAWEKFTAHFHNTEIQENIRNSKEEAYQEGFLEDLFVKVLGYSKNPSPDYNLMVEQKNLTDSKKADGALLDDDKVRGVIELKGTETTDLSKVETQAFGYKNKQPDAMYVIISNFEKLRFYIDNAVDFIEFNLFQLTKEEFKVLWLCLGYANFSKGLPKKIKDASLTEEENVTKELYKDYSDFKHAVFESMKEHNPEHDKLLLFKKTQKLLDRFLFIFFAEDRLLLPPNSIREIINQWMDLRDKYDEYVPLYERFKKYFGYMREGHKGESYEIFAYNGGLFAEDEILDNLDIEDDILYKYTQELSKYDFESEVDVNILGHIFEHSLNEIEEITAELKGEEVDSSKSRRKKDGVYYTPKYITKYIVEHTVGTLCDEKKAELDIVDERFTEAGRRSKKGIADLKNYRAWLLDLTICDPACGSGAFLNQALEFLIAEHQYLDELQAKYHGEALVLSDIEDQILENNLFGVDINEESVEIAKLSLWLRTAQKGRKLTSLNDHIKCGNSLINDSDVAGDKAFKWEEEFPSVFRQKKKQAFHLTWVTHNARTSRRMKDYKVKKGKPFWLNEELEVFITKEIAEIVKEDQLNVLAYNICEDHVHMLLVCEPDELSNTVRKLKGRSSQKLKEYLEVPKEEKFHLWAQKFHRKPVEDDNGLSNVQEYIKHNRNKHDLPTNEGLQPLVEEMCCLREHAFRPEYTGGFDVVIGNPPYVKRQNITEDKIINHYEEIYVSATYNFDLYLLFIERGTQLINKEGFLSYINPSKFTSTKTGKGLRSYLENNSHITRFVDFKEYQVFEDVTTYCCVLFIKSKPGEQTEYFELNPKTPTQIQTFKKSEVSIKDTSSGLGWSLAPTINLNSEYKLKDFVSTFTGIESGADKIYILGSSAPILKEMSNSFGEVVFPLVKGSNVGRYHFEELPYRAIVPYSKEADLLPKEEFKKDHKGVWEYLKDHEDELRGREKGKMDHSDWYGYVYPKNLYKYGKNRVIWSDISIRPQFTIDTTGSWHVRTVCSLELNEHGVDKRLSLKALMALLNSSLLFYFIQTNSNSVRGGYWRYKPQYVKEFPIVKPLFSKQERLESLGDEALINTDKLYLLISNFCDLLLSKYPMEKPTGKLQSWHELTGDQFLKELNKSLNKENRRRRKADETELEKPKLKEEQEWLEHFKEQKAEAEELKAQIAQTDKEIDAMVYELYGLSEEEIEVVEGSV